MEVTLKDRTEPRTLRYYLEEPPRLRSQVHSKWREAALRECQFRESDLLWKALEGYEREHLFQTNRWG